MRRKFLITVDVDLDVLNRVHKENSNSPFVAEQVIMSEMCWVQESGIFAEVITEHNAITAAAPELLEALEACVEVMNHLPTLNGFYGLSVWENAKEALLKAGGEV